MMRRNPLAVVNVTTSIHDAVIERAEWCASCGDGAAPLTSTSRAPPATSAIRARL